MSQLGSFASIWRRTRVRLSLDSRHTRLLFIRRDVQQQSSPRFAERDLWNIRLLKQPHSDLMPANLITLAHFSVSSTTNFSNSEGVMDIGATPRSTSRPEILGSASPAFITPLSRSIGPGRRDRVPLHRGSNPN